MPRKSFRNWVFVTYTAAAWVSLPKTSMTVALVIVLTNGSRNWRRPSIPSKVPFGASHTTLSARRLSAFVNVAAGPGADVILGDLLGGVGCSHCGVSFQVFGLRQRGTRCHAHESRPGRRALVAWSAIQLGTGDLNVVSDNAVGHEVVVRCGLHAQVDAAQRQQVEHDVRLRHRGDQLASLRRRGDEAALECVERQSAVDEDDQFAIYLTRCRWCPRETAAKTSWTCPRRHAGLVACRTSSTW